LDIGSAAIVFEDYVEGLTAEAGLRSLKADCGLDVSSYPSCSICFSPILDFNLFVKSPD